MKALSINSTKSIRGGFLITAGIAFTATTVAYATRWGLDYFRAVWQDELGK